MLWLNGNRTSLVVVGVIAAMVLGGGRQGKAEIIISEPTNLGPVINHSGGVQSCDFSHDGLELYLAFYDRSGGFGGGDIWVSTRETLDSPWQEPVNLGPNVNSSGSQVEPSISSDGLELYFGCWDDYILRVCTRPSNDAPWGKPVKIGPPVGSIQPAMEYGSDDAWRPDISSDGLSLYFSSTRASGYGGTDIWMATRATTADPWTAPINLGPNVNTGGGDVFPNISTDGLTLVFNRGFASIYASTRKSIDDDWGPAVQLEIRAPSPGNFHSAALSPDSTTLYFEAVAAWGGYGRNDFWQVKFIPIVDFNSDEIIDATDMCILVDNWHTENTLCDIAPLPLGDGFVDVQDLVFLAEHLFEDHRLMAHWKMDETEGIIAYDCVGEHDGTLHGEPLWQPTAGKINGALLFDGIDDCVIAGSVLNPADGDFGVFVWVKGNIPGQVILSQIGAANWFCTDLVGGCLMTQLQPAGRGGAPLLSNTCITDNNWHQIGFVWDGSYRHLYVDGVEVANDGAPLPGLISADSGLFLGTGCHREHFFYGMIDDVRIYNVALTAEEIVAMAR